MPRKTKRPELYRDPDVDDAPKGYRRFGSRAEQPEVHTEYEQTLRFYKPLVFDKSLDALRARRRLPVVEDKRFG